MLPGEAIRLSLWRINLLFAADEILSVLVGLIYSEVNVLNPNQKQDAKICSTPFRDIKLRSSGSQLVG